MALGERIKHRRKYLNMTVEALENFGITVIKVEKSADIICICISDSRNSYIAIFKAELAASSYLTKSLTVGSAVFKIDIAYVLHYFQIFNICSFSIK